MTARRDLLDRVVDHLLVAGVSDLSLRSVAAGVGSSHRMLIYHFGSLDGLVEAVVGEVEERQRTFLAGLPVQEAGLALWARLTAPELRPLEGLFFGLYTRLLAEGRDASGLVTAWLEPVTALVGNPAAARLGLAVTRGLLLDLLATGDLEGVDAAHGLWLSLAAGWTHG